MRKLHYLLFAMIMGLAVSFTSCSSDDDAPAGPSEKTNATVADIVALISGDAVVTIAQDLTFDAIVISNQGTSENFYNKLIVQDETAGLEIRSYKSATLAAFEPGQKIIVSAKDMLASKYGFSYQIGVEFEGKVGGMDDAAVALHITAVEGGVEPTVEATAITALTEAMVNTLVKIDAIQFKTSENGKTYAKAELAGDDYKKFENRYLIDAEGNGILLRTANTATFHADVLPEGNGSVTAILGKFNEDYQLFIRSTDDVVMTDERVADPVAPFVDKTVDALAEIFADATVDARVDQDGWFTEAVTGTMNWVTKEYSSAKYIQAAGYNSGQDAIETWVVSPGLNLDAADSKKNFSFDSKRGYTKAEVLKVFVSSDFDYTVGVAAATWEELTVTLPAENGTGYTEWLNSGVIDLSAKTGKVHVAFKYEGNQTDATGTWQVGNVKFNFTPADVDPGEPAEFSNWGFENWTDETHPVGFEKVESVTKEATIIHGGSFAAKVESKSGKQILSFKTPIEAGATYEISFWYLDNDVNAKGRMWSYFKNAAGATVAPLDGDAAKIQAGYTEDSANWQQYKIEVVIPEGATMLEFATRTYKEAAEGGFVYYDDFSVVKK
ncbi:DUF5017 domain-containing protein [Ancylomarina euxinus]|uniref:DUF5017 domain-containing protein n=1 Tax=Ancylomarina euxinus TaxID=2283627 RepID=A0A425Y8D2_9BACT|nr:DUF5689 domain-containing protein [Ancylomarina euxinus]MCZ4693543.1 DUF5689 domain-containing protein [Ancylomarina euxinus]MUP13770.1 DUF5017 domain-containing protein [Ancylomarina euxinus]RRG24592.1 DUF5017 domain-containing protein [Ancylomarina euxinus]